MYYGFILSSSNIWGYTDIKMAFTDVSSFWVKYTPAGDLRKSRFVSCQPCVRACSLGVRRAAVMVGVAEVSLVKANHLQRFAQLNQWWGQTCQAGYSEKKTDISKITRVCHLHWGS